VAGDTERGDDPRQSKSVYQAEIDAACELIDFLRFNVAYARQLLASSQALRQGHGTLWIPAP